MSAAPVPTPAEPALPGGASAHQPPVDAREALAELRALVRSLPEPTRTQARQALTVVSRQVKRTRKKREKEAPEFSKGLRSLINSYASLVGESDFGEDLARMRDDVDYFKAKLGDAVRQQQQCSYCSWAEVGRALGMTPQAAWKRWGQP